MKGAIIAGAGSVLLGVAPFVGLFVTAVSAVTGHAMELDPRDGRPAAVALPASR